MRFKVQTVWNFHLNSIKYMQLSAILKYYRNNFSFQSLLGLVKFISAKPLRTFNPLKTEIQSLSITVSSSYFSILEIKDSPMEKKKNLISLLLSRYLLHPFYAICFSHQTDFVETCFHIVLKSACRCGIKKKKNKHHMLLFSLFFFDHFSMGIFLGSCKSADLVRKKKKTQKGCYCG